MTSYNLTRFTKSKTDQQQRKILDAVEILSRLGIPLEKFTPRQWRRVERLALVLLSLGGVCPNTPWLSVKSKGEKLLELSFLEPSHEELPDIIAFSEQKGWIYLIESVTSFGEISETRKLELEKITKNCAYPIVFVTAFLDRDTYRKYCANLAWETEVWIASDPDHLIHLNGYKFLGPHVK